MEQFVYAVSHDLKSPLITVRAFLNMLEQDVNQGSTTDIEENFFHIRSAADKMAQLLDALYKLSQAGHFSHQPVALPVNDLVANCLTTLAGSIEQRQAAIRVADFPQTLWGDPVKIEQIWQNLIENALKYLGEQPHPYIDMGYEDTRARCFLFATMGWGSIPIKRREFLAFFPSLMRAAKGSAWD